MGELSEVAEWEVEIQKSAQVLAGYLKGLTCNRSLSLQGCHCIGALQSVEGLWKPCYFRPNCIFHLEHVAGRNRSSVAFGEKLNYHLGFRHRVYALLELALHPRTKIPLGLHYLKFHVVIAFEGCDLKLRGMTVIEHRYLTSYVTVVFVADLASLSLD